MVSTEEIISELTGRETDHEYIVLMVRKYGNLAIKIALLGIASNKKMYNPFWIGCPPGVFLSYKWNGPESKEYVQQIHDYLVKLGYQVYFDKNELAEDADGYTSVPEYIANVANCQYYILILTEKTADYITARTGKTSWILDEYQQAITLVNAGRMFLVPLLVEERGATDYFTDQNTINLVNDAYNFEKLDDLFYPVNFKINSETRKIFSDVLDGFDLYLVQHRWPEALMFFEKAIMFKNFPDYQFRLLIYSICNLDMEQAELSFNHCADFTGVQHLPHLLNGYAQIYNLSLLSTNMTAMKMVQ
jgi:hypothetical protein